MIHETSQIAKQKAAVELGGELGWEVLPCWWIEGGKCACGKAGCSSPGKHPIGEAVPKGLHNATADVAIIERWFRKYPQANLAVRTGEHFWALDLDGLDGIRAFNQWLGKRDLPEGPVAITGGGGRHYLFAPDKRIRNAAKVGGASIDVRGADGYIIVGPSNHASGNPYRWEREPTKYDLEPAPTWLIEHVTTGGNGQAIGSKLVMVGSLADQPGAEQGQRNALLCRLVGAYLDQHGVTNELLPLAIAWSERCDPPYPKEDVQRTVVALAKKHISRQPAKATDGNIVLLPYNTIDPEVVDWVWADRIASGKLTIVSGDPGLGKSFMMLDVAARISTGRDFPDGQPADMAEVIFCSAEDGPNDTIRPRLDVLGADVAKVHHLDGVEGKNGDILPFLLDRHLPALDRALEQHDAVRLLIVDPISAVMGDVDSHKNAEVRGVLGPLAKLAEARGVAVVGINHLSKAQGKAIYRSLGSLAFVAAARAAWAIVADPDDQDRRLFLPVKNNLAKSTGLAFRLIDGRVEWEEGAVLLAVDDLDDNETPRDEAKVWLEGILTDGAVQAGKILKQAKADGISERTLRRVKKELAVVSCQFAGAWAWGLPDNTAEGETDGSTTYKF